jgi:hypothetical protein
VEQRTVAISTKQLTKHYDKLTARERFSLIVAAGVRGDEAERERLARSAPKQTFSVPNHRGYAEGFADVGNLYVALQLETGIWMWRVLAVIDTGKKENPRLQQCLAMFANRFLVLKRAWHLLCEEYGVDGDAVLSVHPTWNTARELAELAETFAFSPGEAAVWVSERDEEATLVTAEQIYEGLKVAVEERVTWWL